MTYNLILQYWLDMSFVGAVAMQMLSEWYPTFDYIENWILSKDPNL